MKFLWRKLIIFSIAIAISGIPYLVGAQNGEGEGVYEFGMGQQYDVLFEAIDYYEEQAQLEMYNLGNPEEAWKAQDTSEALKALAKLLGADVDYL